MALLGARAWSVALRGVDGQVVEVEADIGGGLPGVHLVGLPDAALQESRTGSGPRSSTPGATGRTSGSCWPCRRRPLPQDRQRVRPRARRAACSRRPGGVAQRGAATARCWSASWRLDGRLRPVRGVLPCLLAARAAGVRRVVVPEPTLAEAALVDGRRGLRGGRRLGEVLAWLAAPTGWPGRSRRRPCRPGRRRTSRRSSGRTTPGGRWRSRRRAGTTCCWSGRPARARRCSPQRIVGLLPELSADDALELAAIHSVAGRLPADGLSPRARRSWRRTTRRPWPRWSAGAAGCAEAGAVSLAHRGVLFMDEAPEFNGRRPRRAAHAAGGGRGPAGPGRRHGAATRRGSSSCWRPTRAPARPRARPRLRVPARSVRRRYLGRLSGPLLDRVDLRARMLPGHRALGGGRSPRRSTATVRARVLAARAAAAARWAGHGWACNADVPGPALRTRFALPGAVVRPAGRGAAQRRADRPRRRPRAAGRLDGRATCRASPGRTGTPSSRRCTSATGGRRDAAPAERAAGRPARAEATGRGGRCGDDRSGCAGPGTAGAGSAEVERAASDAVLRARAYLSRVAEPPAPALARFVDGGRAGGRPPPGCGPGTCRRRCAAETAARRAVDRAEADLGRGRTPSGRGSLVPEAPDWPAWACAPLTLRRHGRAGRRRWRCGCAVRHALAEACDRAVAVVGARAATGYGTHLAGEFGAGLAAAGAPSSPAPRSASTRPPTAVRWPRDGPDDRRARLRRRPRLPGVARHPARPDRGDAAWS